MRKSSSFFKRREQEVAITIVQYPKKLDGPLKNCKKGTALTSRKWTN